MMFVFLCHISLSVIISMSIHVTVNGIFSFFPWLSTILAYICIMYVCIYVIIIPI